MKNRTDTMQAFDAVRRAHRAAALKTENRAFDAGPGARTLQTRAGGRACEPGCAFPMARLAIAFALLLAATSGMAAGQILIQNFDGIIPPDLPAGWSDGTGWVTSASSASTGSGANNLAHTGTGPDNVISESFSLAGVSGATLSYLARRTSSYPTESLVVMASTDGGATWPITVIAAGAALPTASSEWVSVTGTVPASLLGETAVRLRFEGLGGTTSGSNVRIDDVVIASGAGEGGGGGSGGGTSLGFASASSSVPESSTGLALGVGLTVDAAPGVQAFQFTASWDEPLLAFTGVQRGTPVADLAAWNVAAEPGTQSVSILVLGQSGAMLTSGSHDPVLTLHFDVGSLPEGIPIDVTVGLADLIGALAVPGGTDAGMALALATHVVTVAPRAGIFSAPASVGFGEVAVGASPTTTVTVSNPGGTADLVVSAAVSDHPAFTIEPPSATIAPDASADFTVTFASTQATIGAQSATIAFTHDGANGPVSTVAVSAVGGAGRGDADADAVVDIVDVLVGVDVALGRVSPTADALASLDLYPFPAGDGTVDVRDLTVLVQAILAGAWPDGAPLPDPPAGKGSAPSGNPVRIHVDGSDPQTIRVSSVASEPLRGLQFDLVAPGVEARTAGSASKAAAWIGSSPGLARIVWVSMDGGVLDPGETLLAELAGVAPGSVRLGYAVAVAADGSRRPVVLDTPGPAPSLEVFPVYPNPFHPDAGETLVVRWSAVGIAAIEIFDVLGRRIRSLGAGRGESRWDGLDGSGSRVGPGVYFIRVAAPGRSLTRTVVVTR